MELFWACAIRESGRFWAFSLCLGLSPGYSTLTAFLLVLGHDEGWMGLAAV